jgi:hypothetical protein
MEGNKRERGLVAAYLELSLTIINFKLKQLPVFTILAVN